MNKFFIHILLLVTMAITAGCSNFLDRESQSILPEEDIYADEKLVVAVLANFYGRMDWGQQLGDPGSFGLLDEAAYSSGGPNNMQNYADNLWRVYDYTLIRNINEFIKGINGSTLSEEVKNGYIAEARFIRAWVYFTMVKGLGGVPLVGDDIFDYAPGMDPATIQIARSTEQASYEYIIDECTAVAAILSADKNTNAARANKWVALALKARAALYAASIAKYNVNTPDVQTSGGEVGISSSEAAGFYETAYQTAVEIVNTSPYALHNVNPDKGKNFYEAVSSKASGEVIWARDYIYPGQTHGFTNNVIASSVRGDIDANIVTPILNLVEDFEYIDNRNGALKLRDASGEYLYYDNPSDVFAGKDPRLYGTVIYSGADFAGTTITYQAGIRYMEGGQWRDRTGVPGVVEAPYGVVTGQDGPTTSNDQYVNKTGFNIRKFVEENRDASTRGRGSDMWFVRFRYAEFLMIAAEAALELNKTQVEIAGYVNEIRERAGIQPLTQVTLQDIIRERRVEFAFENHRYWDVKRWRIAHTLWSGQESPTATHYVLFPYKIYAPGTANHNKWVFEKKKASHTMYPRYFRYQNYYNFVDQGWIDRNPKLVRNPYQ